MRRRTSKPNGRRFAAQQAEGVHDSTWLGSRPSHWSGWKPRPKPPGTRSGLRREPSEDHGFSRELYGWTPSRLGSKAAKGASVASHLPSSQCTSQPRIIVAVQAGGDGARCHRLLHIKGPLRPAVVSGTLGALISASSTSATIPCLAHVRRLLSATNPATGN